jgi:hypothetical protein
MPDTATPNLPSRDFGTTSAFYDRLGCSEAAYRDEGWMILTRAKVMLEFFPFARLDPAESSFGCCLRLDDVDAFYRVCLAAGRPESAEGFPRLHPLREESGLRIGALLDTDGSLLRLIGNS